MNCFLVILRMINVIEES